MSRIADVPTRPVRPETVTLGAGRRHLHRDVPEAVGGQRVLMGLAVLRALERVRAGGLGAARRLARYREPTGPSAPALSSLSISPNRTTTWATRGAVQRVAGDAHHVLAEVEDGGVAGAQGHRARLSRGRAGRVGHDPAPAVGAGRRSGDLAVDGDRLRAAVPLRHQARGLARVGDELRVGELPRVADLFDARPALGVEAVRRPAVDLPARVVRLAVVDVVRAVRARVGGPPAGARLGDERLRRSVGVPDQQLGLEGESGLPSFA